MNGAESLVQTLLGSGVDTCFSNPGTSEMHFVAALDRLPGMRCVLGLFEGVVTGAADGYARMTGRPAATLLHCGPGLANGLANLHNARRAGVPLLNCVGDQATYHRPLDAPLTADTEGWARGVGWVRTARAAAEVGADAAVAVQAARAGHGQIATLVLPSDTCWDESGVVAPALPVPVAPPVAPSAVREAARVLRSGEPVLLLLGNPALRAATIADAQRIAAATGARMSAQMFNTRIERGAGRPTLPRVPYVVDAAIAMLAGVRHAILVGATVPVGFFAYPGKPSTLLPAETQVHVLARPDQDAAAALADLADLLAAPTGAAPRHEPVQPATGAISPDAFARSITALLPEGAVIADESITFGRSVFPATQGAAPHDWLQVMGGAIGGGMPLATGAALGAPGRRVVNLQADGSAMYTLQALWTQARERLDVTTVIFANRKYAILLQELANVGANPGRTALDMLDIGRPDLDFVRLAAGMGVEAARASTMAEFNDLFAHANRRPGPFVIELAIG
jgi:acetolactate synthase-1/2/3 large subunit